MALIIEHFSQTKQTTKDAHFGGLKISSENNNNKNKNKNKKDVKRVRKTLNYQIYISLVLLC